jgi:hypothetical protein
MSSSLSNSYPHQRQPHLQDLLSLLPTTAPRVTQVCPATGYYYALHEGEGATSTSIEEIGEEDKTYWAAAAAEVEPTLKKVLNGPDGVE